MREVCRYCTFQNEMTIENVQTPVLTWHGYNIAIKKVFKVNNENNATTSTTTICTLFTYTAPT